MTRTMCIVISLIGLAVNSGCGSSGPSEGSVAVAMQRAIRINDHGSRFERVTCVKHGDREFLCSGNYVESVAETRAALAGADTSGFSRGEFVRLARSRSGVVAYDVTTDGDRVVYVPR